MDITDRGYQLIKQELFRHLRTDSNAYKDSYLIRRIRARMRKLGISDFMDYYRLIKKNKAELDDLLLTVAINVTEFFRDPIVWRTLESKVLPELIRFKKRKPLYNNKGVECCLLYWTRALLDSNDVQ